MDKLSELLKKQGELADGLKAINDEVAREKVAVVSNRGKDLFASILSFAEMFTSGIVFEEFEKIRQKLVDLEAVDPNYLGTIGQSDFYGELTDPVRYLSEYVLQSKWRSDSTLWSALGQIYETKDNPTNPFIGGN